MNEQKFIHTNTQNIPSLRTCLNGKVSLITAIFLTAEQLPVQVEIFLIMV